ncbi:hypothetical protein GPOL_c25140 [Gordonia polyisoprenivorans VH2]|uniref:ABM domain-containing protein n=1 Tax=Gordonia polyisoprenivorans (strain DSM 44266 / VH2) TaxID=1112204 RepID=H6N3S2_GORPV|nr:antibiotic biosynthesis monooxygenase [Gordonia polyisoprenivorans]AFA73543.1 hypothetical protein GPOL_c25140 [Gordonia polyisoprenivorans VH2]
MGNPTIAAVAVMKPTEGNTDALHRHLSSLAAVTLDEAGSTSCAVVKVDAAEPYFVIVESFVDQAAYDAHEASPQVLEIAGAIGEVLAEATIHAGSVSSGRF